MLTYLSGHLNLMFVTPGADIVARAGLEDKWVDPPSNKCVMVDLLASDNSYFYMEHVGNTVGWTFFC